MEAGRYGSRLHFWNLAERRLEETVDLGESGLIPLEIRWLHDPEAEQGFVGAALSSNSEFVTYRRAPSSDSWSICGPPVNGRGPSPGRPSRPPSHSRPVSLGLAGVRDVVLAQVAVQPVGEVEEAVVHGEHEVGHEPGDATRQRPALELLVLDVHDRLGWDNQFYPDLESWMVKVDSDPEGGMRLDPDFFVDFHARSGGPARAHEVRLSGGDCTTEIFQ